MEEREQRGLNWPTVIVALGLIVIICSFIGPIFGPPRGPGIWVKTSPKMTAVLNAFHDYATEHDGYFPPAYDPKTGGDHWLESTIYLQIYPDSFSTIDETGNALPSNDVFAPDPLNGKHLTKTVFECPASLQQNPKEKNWYNHSWVLNRNLITEAKFRQLPFPEYSPRKRSIFIDDAATMLITEGIVGDYNSVSHTDFARIKAAADRYDGEYVHVGFMDGHVERVKLRNFPKELSTDENAFFWTGASVADLKRMSEEE